MFHRIHSAALLLAGLLAGCASNGGVNPKPFPQPQLISVKKIWDEGGHNAFTDLIRFNDKWYCTFRESAGHMVGDGKIRVLVSTDADTWRSAALLKEDGIDLRDPKFSITPNQQLMLVFNETTWEDKKAVRHQSNMAFSEDGFRWPDLIHILEVDDWLWRATWHKGRLYGVVYKTSQKRAGAAARLVREYNELPFDTVADFDIPNRPNEATARFLKNDDCVVLIRREEADKSAWIGRSSAPYTNWKWQPAGLFIGGPNFIVLPDGSMIASGRMIDPTTKSPKTFIGVMDFQSVTPLLTLPSGGDCSYPGLVWHDGMLYVSYYSSHEGKTSIYLAKIKM